MGQVDVKPDLSFVTWPLLTGNFHDCKKSLLDGIASPIVHVHLSMNQGSSAMLLGYTDTFLLGTSATMFFKLPRAS